MSKKEVQSGPQLSFGPAYVLPDYAYDHLIGKIFTVLESWGLPAKQEEATKQMIRQAVGDVLEDTVFISSERHTELRKLRDKMRAENILNVPLNGI